MEATEEVYISQIQAAKMLGIKPSTIKSWRKKYLDFPKPYRISNNAVHFKKSEIEEWMEKRREE